MQFQTAYSKKKRYTTIFKDKSLTKQSQFGEADINSIIKRHLNPTMLADLNKLEQVYGEITSQDLLTAHQKLDAAQEAFMEIPSEIRRQFNQDPGQFIDYATNPDNIEQMREWGLAHKENNQSEPEPEPTPDPETPQKTE